MPRVRAAAMASSTDRIQPIVMCNGFVVIQREHGESHKEPFGSGQPSSCCSARIDSTGQRAS